MEYVLVLKDDDFDGFIKKIKARTDIVLLHDVITHSWGQRVIRFYDIDNHLVEVGEKLKCVVERTVFRTRNDKERDC